MYMNWKLLDIAILSVLQAIISTAVLLPSPTPPLQPKSSGTELDLNEVGNSSHLIGANTTTIFPIIFPHIIIVPNSETILYLRFGLRRRALSPDFMQSLLVVAEDYIHQNIEEFGAHALYPIGPDNRQEFFKSLGDGIKLEIVNILPDEFFTWGTLDEVVEGLMIYLIQGERYRQCYFEFDDGNGIIGSGQLVKENALNTWGLENETSTE